MFREYRGLRDIGTSANVYLPLLALVLTSAWLLRVCSWWAFWSDFLDTSNLLQIAWAIAYPIAKDFYPGGAILDYADIATNDLILPEFSNDSSLWSAPTQGDAVFRLCTTSIRVREGHVLTLTFGVPCKELYVLSELCLQDKIWCDQSWRTS